MGVHVTKAAVAMLYSSQINPTFQAALFFMTSCTVDLVFVCDLIVNSVPLIVERKKKMQTIDPIVLK